MSTQRSSASNSAIASADTQLAVEDRRITRSKRALRDALVELIEERGLTNFSASDLCARADLNRGTLYNNFGDMEGLLAALEDDIMDDSDRPPVMHAAAQPKGRAALSREQKAACRFW